MILRDEYMRNQAATIRIILFSPSQGQNISGPLCSTGRLPLPHITCTAKLLNPKIRIQSTMLKHVTEIEFLVTRVH